MRSGLEVEGDPKLGCALTVKNKMTYESKKQKLKVITTSPQS